MIQEAQLLRKLCFFKNFRRIKNVKTAIITGSSRGLGAVIAQTLINKGYNVGEL